MVAAIGLPRGKDEAKAKTRQRRGEGFQRGFKEAKGFNEAFKEVVSTKYNGTSLTSLMPFLPAAAARPVMAAAMVMEEEAAKKRAEEEAAKAKVVAETKVRKAAEEQLRLTPQQRWQSNRTSPHTSVFWM